jgi:aminopeptidase N
MPVAKETVSGSVKTVYYEESPLMSTYLVAIVVGIFDYIESSTSEGIRSVFTVHYLTTSFKMFFYCSFPNSISIHLFN